MSFHDPAQFAFAAPLRDNWRAIYREYLAVRSRLADWPERKLYGEGWKVFGLYDFPNGEPLEDNIRHCALTARLVEEHVPRHGAAGFSVLAPGTEIQPHRGYQGPFLRCHLGLRVPEGDCGLELESETRGWREGEVLVFDDRRPHRAWNRTAEERVVLLFDFVPQA